MYYPRFLDNLEGILWYTWCREQMKFSNPMLSSNNGLIHFCTFDYHLFHDLLTQQGKFWLWYKNSSIKTIEPKCANKSYTSDTARALLPDPIWIPPLLHPVLNTSSGFWWRRRVCYSTTLDVGSTSCYWFFYAPGGFSLFNEQNPWFSVNFSENWPSLTPFSSLQPFENIWELLSIWFYIMWCTSITWPVIAKTFPLLFHHLSFPLHPDEVASQR